MLKRREFIGLLASSAAAGAVSQVMPRTAVAVNLAQQSPGFEFTSRFYRLALSPDAPEITCLSIDSLGKGKLSVNPILDQSAGPKKPWAVRRTDDSFSYLALHQGKVTRAGWTFQCYPKQILKLYYYE